MESIVYLNGSFLPLKDAKVTITDYAFLFGYSLFETMRAYCGKVFRLDDHLSRLEKSAAFLEIPIKVSELKRAVLQILLKNELQDARVRLVVSAGEGAVTPDTRSCKSPTVLVIAVGYSPHPPETYNRGFTAIISSIHRNSQSPLPGMKTSDLLESLLAKREARNAGVDDAILLNDKGLVAEASSSNIFIVGSGALKTPRLGEGLLPGITRQVIAELAADTGVRLLETDIRQAELLTAEEAFLSNSMIEIMPLTRIGGRVIGAGDSGSVTCKMMSAYRSLVIRETV
jgi:branched-chain amino acid aminotransferase